MAVFTLINNALPRMPWIMWITWLVLLSTMTLSLPAKSQSESSPSSLSPFEVCGPERMLMQRSPGMSGSDVVELQERLKTLGYDPGAIDGVFGPATSRAVRQFQNDHSIPVDGRVGDETWMALGPLYTPVEATHSLDYSVLASTPGENDDRPVQHAIIIDTNKFTLTLTIDGEVYKTWPIGVGQPTELTLTPVGEWRIIQKDKDWGGGFGTRWLGLNVPWGIYGIHGTNKPWSIGTRASAGCIRMNNRDVEELWDIVPLHTPVKIVGVEPEVTFQRTLREGATGRDVVFVQLYLQDRGFDVQGADGRFGPNTSRAVLELQQLYGLPADGELYDDIYYVLGLK